jgi:chitinase
MPSGTSISICAPASFWYLQLFPIQEMAAVIDYVIFMTYDLHGQWDYGNAFSDPGCSGGNCLRSDVNLTETINALSMITKAGVPSNQIIVGVTSYGRSFQMTTAGCYTELCTYTGHWSGAYAGLCTETPGYIANAEINSILDGNGTLTSGNGSPVNVGTNFMTYLDSNSYSNIVVYDDTQWVGYMDDDNKASRELIYIDLNFCGWADWAIDLQTYDGDNSSNNESVVYLSPSIWTEPDAVAQCTPPCILVLPPSQLGSSTVFTFPPYVTSLEVGWITTVIVTVDGAVSTSIGFTGMIETTTLSIPPLTTTAVNFWNINVTSGASSLMITPTSSILPPPFTITDVYPAGVTAAPGVRTITPPPSPYLVELGSSQPTQTYTPSYSTQATLSGTLVIDGATIENPYLTITEPAGQVVVIAPSNIIIVDGATIVNPTSPTTTDGVTILPPLPVFTTFPSQTIQPYTSSSIPTPTVVTVNGKKEPVIPCSAWFFFVSCSHDPHLRTSSSQ